MKLPRKVSLILLLIFSLVCSPVLAAINRDSSIHTISKSNLELGMEIKSQQEGILIGQAAKKRQGFFSKFNIRRQRKSKVRQKQKRQGFFSKFKLGQNRNKQPKKQKRGFLRRFGIGRT